MKNIKKILFALTLIFGAFISTTKALDVTRDDLDTYFSDSNFADSVWNSMIGNEDKLTVGTVSTDIITIADDKTIEDLLRGYKGIVVANNKGITNIDGILYLRGAEKINLDNNLITDISELQMDAVDANYFDVVTSITFNNNKITKFGSNGNYLGGPISLTINRVDFGSRNKIIISDSISSVKIPLQKITDMNGQGMKVSNLNTVELNGTLGNEITTVDETVTLDKINNLAIISNIKNSTSLRFWVDSGTNSVVSVIKERNNTLTPDSFTYNYNFTQPITLTRKITIIDKIDSKDNVVKTANLTDSDLPEGIKNQNNTCTGSTIDNGIDEFTKVVNGVIVTNADGSYQKEANDQNCKKQYGFEDTDIIITKPEYYDNYNDFKLTRLELIDKDGNILKETSTIEEMNEYLEVEGVYKSDMQIIVYHAPKNANVINNPNTSDNSLSFIIISIISLLGFIGLIKYTKRNYISR